MKITNKYNLPAPIVSAVSSGARKPIAGRISVTELIAPPRIRVLKMRHWDTLEEDASDRIWALLGSAVHGVLEKADTTSHWAEERIQAVIDPWVVTGQPDLLDAEGCLDDYKVTSVFSFLLGAKKEWEAQLNCYAALYDFNGFPVKKLRIIAILRDWNAGKALNGGDYPAVPVLVKKIPLWPLHTRIDYLTTRVKLHQDAEEHGIIPDCTDEEVWARPTTWAVMKKGRKSAVRVFETENMARKMAEDTGYDVIERKGGAIRCERYCPVRSFCERGMKETTNAEPQKSGVNETQETITP